MVCDCCGLSKLSESRHGAGSYTLPWIVQAFLLFTDVDPQ